MDTFNIPGLSNLDSYVPGYEPTDYSSFGQSLNWGGVPEVSVHPATAYGFDAPTRPLGQGSFNTQITPNFTVKTPITPSWSTGWDHIKNTASDAFSDGFQLQDLNQIGSAVGDFGNLTRQRVVDAINNNPAVDMAKEGWGQLSGPEKFNTVWGGLQSLGNLYGTFKGLQMAKDQQRFQKDMWNKTWDANKKQFNEAVGARADSRYNTAADQEERQAHKNKYSI